MDNPTPDPVYNSVSRDTPVRSVHITNGAPIIDGEPAPWLIGTGITVTTANGRRDHHEVTITFPCQQVTIDADAMSRTTFVRSRI